MVWCWIDLWVWWFSGFVGLVIFWFSGLVSFCGGLIGLFSLLVFCFVLCLWLRMIAVAYGFVNSVDVACSLYCRALDFSFWCLFDYCLVLVILCLVLD